MRLLIGTALVVALGIAPLGRADAAPTAMEQQCFDAVQGKVAYNQQGSRSWVESNIRSLCQGTTNPAATIACFQGEIRTHNSWQRGIQACTTKPTAGGTPAPPSSETARSPQSPPTGAPSSKPTTSAASRSIDPSFMLLRSGPVTGESDAVSKCTAACRHYEGFSGHWAIAVEPDLGVCQCRARPLREIAAHEILTDVIRTAGEAARTCPGACRWYGGGDGTWDALNDHNSICGCVERVAP